VEPIEVTKEIVAGVVHDDFAGRDVCVDLTLTSRPPQVR